MLFKKENRVFIQTFWTWAIISFFLFGTGTGQSCPPDAWDFYQPRIAKFAFTFNVGMLILSYIGVTRYLTKPIVQFFSLETHRQITWAAINAMNIFLFVYVFTGRSILSYLYLEHQAILKSVPPFLLALLK